MLLVTSLILVKYVILKVVDSSTPVTPKQSTVTHSLSDTLPVLEDRHDDVGNTKNMLARNKGETLNKSSYNAHKKRQRSFFVTFLSK